jgi:hypothetical protein
VKITTRDEGPLSIRERGAGRDRALLAVVAVAAAVGLVLRFFAHGPLWLDEALSVSIADLPFSQVTDALRHDGSPPFYYLLLHAWLAVFGHGPVVARALSGVLSVATVPAAWAFAREISGSRRVAWITAALVATSPFAARYGSEARMYALLQLLCALGGLALVRTMRRPTIWNTAGTAACAGLLALTHYWALFLLAAVAGLLLRRRAWQSLGALAAGGVLFLPWLPSFLFQLKHTGTPWAPRPQFSALVDAVFEWSGGGTPGRLLGVLMLALAGLGVFGATNAGRHIELDLHGRPLGRRLAVVTFGTLGLGVLVGLLAGSGYAARYSAVVVVPFVALAAVGASIVDDRVRPAVVAAAAVLGVFAAVPAVLTPRTQAGAIAAALWSRARPGDVVVYCPDQLGPAVSRLTQPGLAQRVFPTGGPPERVDWVDYQQRNEAGDPATFADDLLRDASGRTIWLVVAGGYRTYGDRCDVLTETLRARRPGNETVVRSRRRYNPERATLVELRP